MFLDININKFYNEVDCICFDGLYDNTVKEFIDKFSNIGYNISLKNFCFPIKKDKGINLSIDEKKFNEELDNKTYNIQLKLSIVLLNIKYFTEFFGIEENNHYNKWKELEFDYHHKHNSSININNEITLKSQYKIENIHEIKVLQNQMINNLNIAIQNNTNDIDEDVMIIDDSEKLYEIQYVIKHKKVKNSYEYLVKWKNYTKEHNSWISEKDFVEKDIILSYWKSIEKNI
ncbi:hypothetical protein BJ944DRAFT_166756 [Cunninghamella echinulata]|nr:hypothetical protein BJ944DRAFT_166756 [Cunninghamella echinulata]